jgi:hypothetical protein
MALFMVKLMVADASAQTITSTASTVVETFTRAGQPIGPVPASNLVGKPLAGPETNLGLVPVKTSKGVIYVRLISLITTAPPPPAPSGPCVKIAALPGENQTDMTNGLGGSCKK